MSRSPRRSRVIGVAIADSEKADKRRGHRALRSAQRAAIAHGREVMPRVRDTSDIWQMAKGHKFRFDASGHPELMRK